MRKALVVGIDDYPSAPLASCVSDANSIATVLETHASGSPNFSVKRLTSPTATVTRAELRPAIEKLFAGNSDVALFYFSGHGLITSAGGYIATSDAERYDAGIPMDEILGLANSSEAKERVVILDCCHAGAFGNPKITGSNTAQLSEGLTVLTACHESESAYENVFTRLLVDALQGGAADLRGYITPGSVYTYVDQALGPWDQRPIFKTNVTRFTSLRSIAPPVPFETLRKISDYFPSPEHEYKLDPSYEFTDPSNDPAHVAIFKDLQKFESVNLVKPVGEEHMYFAAINRKCCRLTALGYQYWRLAKEKKL